MPRLPSLLRWVALGCVIGGAGAVSATAGGIKSERLLAAILTNTPASIVVPSGKQWQRAEEAALEIPGAIAFWGVGESMEPLFPHHTAIVVAPLAFAELKKGMTVVYVTRTGRMVAHSLIGDVPGGWIAQGINNEDEDEELVTRENLVGVIVEAYSEIPSTRRMALFNDLVAKRRVTRART